MNRFLEIDSTGLAFHETDFAGQVPPTEVYYCDCYGPGRETWNPQVQHDEHPILELWKDAHKDCGYRRQIFVDVTKRKDARLGMQYDEATDTFTNPPKVG